MSNIVKEEPVDKGADKNKIHAGKESKNSDDGHRKKQSKKVEPETSDSSSEDKTKRKKKNKKKKKHKKGGASSSSSYSSSGETELEEEIEWVEIQPRGAGDARFAATGYNYDSEDEGFGPTPA